MFLRRVTLLLGAVAIAAACGAAEGSSGDATQPGTVAVGGLPPTFVTNPAETQQPVLPTSPRTTTPISPDAQVGKLVEGNRVILIGDSVMASTSRRYSNDICKALVPLGWQAEVDAETGRFIEFGDEVLDQRLSADWDTAVILLGNNYREDPGAYLEDLNALVERLAPRPVVLLTVSEFTQSRVEVNDIIFNLAQLHDNVLIVDWGATTAADPHLLGADGLHLTTKGREALAAQIALALGEAPVGPGKCLDTTFTDDSMGSVQGTTTTVRSRPVTTPPKTTQGGADTTEAPPETTPPPGSLP